MPAAIIAFIVACIWGLNPIFEKLSLKNASPMVVITIRFLFTTACLVIITLSTGRVKDMFSVDGRTLFWILLSGFIGGLIGLFLFFVALKKGEASFIVPIVATFPLFTALYSYMFLNENITSVRLIGIIFVVIGAMLINWKGLVEKL